jgi:RHS repeat-associated protein
MICKRTPVEGEIVTRLIAVVRACLKFGRHLITLAIAGVSVVTAMAANPPLMAIPGQFGVGSMGDATYSIAIQVPPGTAGMAPALSLDYSSSGSNGPVGIGWSLRYGAMNASSLAPYSRNGQLVPRNGDGYSVDRGPSGDTRDSNTAGSAVSMITRCAKTIAQDGVHGGIRNNADDRFCLGGKRLVSVSGSYGASGTVYRTEIADYSEITSFGTSGTGPSYFIVKTKAGLTFEYGNSSDSRYLTTDGSGTARGWALNKISNTNGNYLTITYVNDTANGQIYPSRIDYTMNNATGLTAHQSVQFFYNTNRPDVVPLYQAGSLQRTTVLLTNIKTYYNSTLVQDYRLAYQLGSATTRSRLASVTRCDAAGNCLAPTTFGWEGSRNQLTSATQTLNLSGGQGFIPIFGDINGDGLTDAVLTNFNGCAGADYSICSPNMIQLLGVNGSLFPNAISVSPTCCTGGWNTGQYPSGGGRGALIDINGDGIDDLDWVQGEVSISDGCEDDTGYCTTSPHHYYLMNNGSGAFTQVGSSSQTSWAMFNYGFGDFDGDGRIDFANFKVVNPFPTGQFYSVPGNGTGTFLDNILPIPTVGGTFTVLWQGSSAITWVSPPFDLGDADADGRTDVVFLDYDAQTSRYNTPGFGWTTYTAARTKSVTGDFNGDGATDVLTFDSDGLNDNVAKIKYGNSNGATATISFPSQPYRTYAPPYNGDSIHFVRVGDWNGDGMADIAMFTGSNWTIYLSTGSSFVQAAVLGISHLFEDPIVSDLNSDGAADVWFSNDTYIPGITYLSGTAWISPYVPERIQTISNGIGATTTITYDRLNRNGSFYTKGSGAVFPTQDIDGPIYAVEHVDQSNGIGGVFTISYAYAGLKRNVHGRGFLGFTQVKQTNAQTNVVTTTNYLTAFPFTGEVASQIQTWNSVTPQSVVNTYVDVDLGAGTDGVVRHETRVTQTVTSSNDTNGATLPTTTTSYNNYDDYGNPQNTVVNVSDGSSQSTTLTYLHNTAAPWLTSLVTSAVVRNIVGSSDVTRTTCRTYGAPPNAGNASDMSGLPLRDVIEPLSTSNCTYSSLGVQNDYTYDGYGNTISSVRSSSAVSYVSPNNTVTSCTTGFGYDTDGRFLTSKTNCLSQTEYWSYTSDASLGFGVPTDHTDLNNHVTSWIYDSFGRMVQETRPDSNRTVMTYAYCSGVNGGTAASCPANGAVVVTVLPQNSAGAQRGAQSRAFYDSLGRTLASDIQGSEGQWIRTATEYNAYGLTLRTSRPYFLDGGAQKWTTNNFQIGTTGVIDPLGRVWQMTMPDNTHTTFCYNGLKSAVISEINQVQTTTKNAQGLIATVSQGYNGATSSCDPVLTVTTTSYAYEAFGSLATITDNAGNVTRNYYNVRGFRTETYDPDMGHWFYAQDALGRLSSQTDAQNQTSTLTYDVLDRLYGATEGTFTRTFRYDTQANGIGLSASTGSSDGTGRTFSYDSLSRPISSALTVDGATYTTNTTYNDDGRIEAIGYPSGFTVIYAYSTYGYISQVRDNANNASLWQAGPRDAELHLASQTFGNNVTQTNSYDANTGRLQNIRAGTNDQVAAFDYSYDPVGLLTYRSDNLNGTFERFCYDPLNRLTDYASGNAVTTCTSSQNQRNIAYDSIGNITNKTSVGAYAYPASGQARPHAVTAITGTVNGVVNPSFTYDGNGNMTAGAGRTVSYTVFNMTASITQGATTLNYAYDATHNRVRQTETNGSTTTTTIYVDDLASGFSAEKIATSASNYRWNDYIVLPMGIAFDGKALGVRIGMHVTTVTNGAVASTANRYFVLDHLGSTAVITKDDGSVDERLAYDPWGRRRNLDGSDDTSGTIRSQTNRGFTSHEMIDDVGLINMNARVYDPQLGRFMSADPLDWLSWQNGSEDLRMRFLSYISSPQNLNLYTYVGNDPMDKTDLSGMEMGPAFRADSFSLERAARAAGGYGLPPSSPEEQAMGREGIGLLLDFLPIVGEYRAGREFASHTTFLNAGVVGMSLVDLGGVAKVGRLIRSLERGALRLERNAATHEARAAAFSANPTVRPGMERMSKEAIARQQSIRVQHLRDEAAEFRRQASENRDIAEELRRKLR